ncbi:30S ribosomal protein S8 [Candidatus Kaiserbacteria bacterium]|nr:30S ribosomal protein S8 [Candidatus Kaiserbacteria bacterium]NCT01936.1 30S ribosomal protein S8 [Candidatus Parcubacteria bacterium]
MVGDTIGDLIIRLKNAGAVRKATVSVPYSKLRKAVLDKLVSAGYVMSATEKGKEVQEKTLEVTLSYENGEHRINGVKRISKPGRRLYTKVTDIHPVKFGKGHLILSTPAGILTGEEAKEKQMGGEQLFIIW